MIKPLAKRVLILLGLTAAVVIHKRILGSGASTIIISNDEMEDIMKKVKSLKDSGLLLKGVSETIKNVVKEKKEVFLVCYQVH